MGTRIGQKLNEKWRIGAKHALFHKAGKWYMPLERFPGAYCDPNGYVLFATEADYKCSPYLTFHSDTNGSVTVRPRLEDTPEYKLAPPD